MYGRAERHTCVSSRWHLLLLGPHSHSLAPPLATGEQPQRATSGRGCWRGTQVTAVLNAGCLSYPPGCFDSPRSSSAWCSPRSCCVCLLPALVSVCALSRVRLFATFWTVAPQAPLSMGLFRQEYWSGLPFPSPGIGPASPVSPEFQADSFPAEALGKPLELMKLLFNIPVDFVERQNCPLPQP